MASPGPVSSRVGKINLLYMSSIIVRAGFSDYIDGGRRLPNIVRPVIKRICLTFLIKKIIIIIVEECMPVLKGSDICEYCFVRKFF